MAQRKGSTLNYMHQEHLGSTSVTTRSDGSQTSSIYYFPWGSARSAFGNIPTDKKFTGQRLDSTGLYYYNARYYDPSIGRCISPDTIVPNPMNPQSLNRYSYCLNNPLRYIDPTGHAGDGLDSPTADGELGWTANGGWVISNNGQWCSISSQAVSTLTTAYAESSFSTWSAFLGSIGKPRVPGAHAFGNFYWSAFYTESREKYFLEGKSREATLFLAEEHQMTTKDWILTCDIFTLAAEPFGAPGYVVSATASSIGYSLTLAEYRSERITRDDMMRAHVNWATGFIPFWGAFPAAAQLYIDWPK